MISWLFLVKPVDNLTMTLTGATPLARSYAFVLTQVSSKAIRIAYQIGAKNPLWGLLEKFENLFEVYSAKGISVNDAYIRPIRGNVHPVS